MVYDLTSLTNAHFSACMCDRENKTPMHFLCYSIGLLPVGQCSLPVIYEFVLPHSLVKILISFP